VRRRFFWTIAAGLALAPAGVLAAGPWLPAGPPSESERAELRARYARPEQVPHPEDNTPSAARENLGRTLFFDPRLSGSGIMSCGTCHNPGLSWSDGLDRGVGHGSKRLARRTPTILNAGFAEALFWDGRASSLEEQALGPISSPDEMNMPLEQLIPKLKAVPGYAPLFEAAYPGEGISAPTVAKALASFQRTVVSARAPFDRWLAGEERAISDSAKRGFALFEGKARCATCHAGWRFTDDSFHDIGVPGEDRGRGAVLEGIAVLEFAFKTPTLRDVERRAPYMHDGSEKTLAEVIELYDLGGRVRRPSLSAEIVPLELTLQEKEDLVAFMNTLTGEEPLASIPRLPR
jgi:cytochrome c peroxidase